MDKPRPNLLNNLTVNLFQDQKNFSKPLTLKRLKLPKKTRFKVFLKQLNESMINFYDQGLVVNALIQQRFKQAGKFLRQEANQRSYLGAAGVNLALIILVLLSGTKSTQKMISPIINSIQQAPLQPLNQTKSNNEVMGFAPFWTFDKLNNVDFQALTTLAYFGVIVAGDGSLDQYDQGYQTFESPKATDLFQKAHQNGTRVVLTITQMDNGPILALLDDPNAQDQAISQITDLVANRGIDGVNVDFEYGGDPGDVYRAKFTDFVNKLSQSMHSKVPNSFVTVSVYAASAKDPKIYDIRSLSQVTDGIFMMAYDFATRGADQAMPTSPLYGHQDGTYWYDVASAVTDFLTQMPANKLILGVPWYGYNYLVYEPAIKAETRPNWSWRGQPKVDTYATASTDITPNMDGIDGYQEGWDSEGQVGYKAYHVASTDTWRMVFIEDVRSLGLKYDYVKQKGLKGVGIWALGFDNGTTELWSELKDKFGIKLVDSSVVGKSVEASL